MNIIGKTDNGVSVVDGVFFLQTSVGLPLGIIVEELKDHNCIPAWDQYIIDALDGGWFGPTIYATLIQQGLPIREIQRTMVAILADYQYDD